MNLRLRLSILCLLGCCNPVIADQVHLKNGDRLSGEILRADSSSIRLKTDYAGEVTIPLDAAQQIVTENTVSVTMKEGNTVDGVVTIQQGSIIIRREDREIRKAMTEIEAIRSKEIQELEVERYRSPGWTDLWSGSLESGLSLTAGNSETTNLSIGANAIRATKADKTSFYLASIYAKDSTTGPSRTTANAIRGGGRYEYNWSERLATFGFSDLEHDEFQNLDLRWVLGGGIGWYLRRNAGMQLQFFGGASYNRENFSNDVTRNSGELLAGEEFVYQMSKKFALKERFVFFPNLNDTGEFRIILDSSILASLNQRLAWHITFSDRYLSNPVGGADENDFLLSTGLRLSFP